jgi:hypothetical protein
MECAMTAENRQSETKRDPDQVVQHAQAILNTDIHFRGRAARFEFVRRDDILIVRGAVPTFYLKQVLQSVLKDVKGVRLIDNQVQVVSAREQR